MVIIETAIFTRRIQQYLTDEQYRQLQQLLIRYPETGNLIPGSGGLRKIRWKGAGHGKRGGLRIIYFWANSTNRLLMLFVYPKTEQEDLSPDQLRMLKRIIDEEYS